MIAHAAPLPLQRRSMTLGLLIASAALLMATTAFGSPSAVTSTYAQNFRQPGESKVDSLTSPGRSHIKIDFIPVEERVSRTRRGFPCVTAPEGAYGIEGHGTPTSVFCRTGEPMSARELAKWITNDGRYQAGMTVYLLCCETGKGDRSFAQKLANTLGTEVVAPTEKLWPLQNGLFIVAQERMRKTALGFQAGEQRADVTRLGAMKTFTPANAAATTTTTVAATSGDDESPTSSSSAAPLARTHTTPKKPMLRASARTAALLAGIQGQRDSTVYLNSKKD